jgi:Tol biopolymer transport system component
MSGQTGDQSTMETALTREGSIIGTVSYMSPEQTRGEAVDARSDVFSLGCLLYEAATGQQPFTGLSAVAVMHQIATVEPAPPSSLRAGIPAAWDAVISKCLRKAPEERYASMNALEADLRLLDSAPRAAAPAMQLAGTRFGRKTLLLALGAALAAVALAAGLWLQKTEYFWRDPIAGARFQTVAELDGIGREAAVSRDGQFVAFLSGRDGQMDVWLTQIGSGQFHNLTQGAAKDIVNHELRSPGFSPDGSLVTFWARQPEARGGGGIDVWASPTLGGSPRLYLAGGAEFDWSRDGSRLVYHLSGPGDPMFVSDGVDRPRKAIFAAPNGTHCHFPLWSPDMAFIYFVQGTFPDKLDIWRMPATGGRTERITGHNSRVTYPVFLDKRTLLYLASDAEGSGPWLYSMDIDRRISHRLGTGLDRYTSLAASADGRRLVLTRATPQRSLWKLRLGDTPAANAQAARIPLTTAAGSSPRLGPGYLLYVSGAGASESLWKIAGGSSTELWTGQGARIAGGPAISPDGMRVAFTVRRREGTLLYTIQANGMHPRIVSDSLDLVGDPAWAPDGQSITAAVQKNGAPALYRVPLDGSAPTRLAQEYSVDPAWAPGGDFAVYSGPDVGTTFPLSALTPGGTAYPLPPLNLTRGARHVVVLSSRELVLLRGEMEHKDLWLADLKTGATRQLSNFPTDFNVRDFDIGPDGREVVLDLEQERSDVVSLDLPRR